MLQYRDHAFAAPDGVWPPVEALRAVAEANGVRDEEPEQPGSKCTRRVLGDLLLDTTCSVVAWHSLASHSISM